MEAKCQSAYTTHKHKMYIFEGRQDKVDFKTRIYMDIS